jgi:hypothetical protein
MSFTDFKEVALPTSGTSAKYGSQDLLDVMQILNGKTVSGRRPKVANQWLWQGAQDIAEIVAPASPSAGTQRFYIDAADHIPKMKDSSGVVTAFSAAGSSVNINQSNTYGDFDQIFRSTRVKIRNPANTFSYSLVGSAITAARNVTLPLLTGDDQITTDAVATSLTNKTIDYNLNTITNLPGGGTGNVSTTQSNTYGDFDQIFRSTRLKLTNPANTFNYSFVGSAITAARNVTIPLLTGDDTMVTAAFAQTLTNKTLTSPTINTPTITTPSFSTISNTGTITLPTATDTLVGRTTTDTLTNKTVNPANNTIADTTPAAGDLLKGNGTKYVQLARGSANSVLAVNSGGTDLAWTALQAERTGKSTASGNGSTTVFTIAHGLGSTPTYTFATCSSLTTGMSYTVDATNITVTFATAPPSGSNNVVTYWRVIA